MSVVAVCALVVFALWFHGFMESLTAQDKGKAPHEIFPDLLHWEVGDEIDSYSWLGSRTYKGASEQGAVFLEDAFGRATTISVRAAMRCRNESLLIRRQATMREDAQPYMDLISEFQRAYAQLEAEDEAGSSPGEKPGLNPVTVDPKKYAAANLTNIAPEEAEVLEALAAIRQARDAALAAESKRLARKHDEEVMKDTRENP